MGWSLFTSTVAEKFRSSFAYRVMFGFMRSAMVGKTRQKKDE